MLVYGHGNLEPGNLINSAESFPLTRAAGVDGVELDVRLSSDGELVVIHDPQYGDGRSVSHTTAADRPDDVILLATALDLCAGLIVNIELKNYPQDTEFDPDEQIVHRSVELLEGRDNLDRVLFSCFGIAGLNRARELRPDLETAHLVLSRRPAAEVVKTCVDHGHTIIHPYFEMVDDAFMEIARRHNLTVNAWTGFDETDETLERLFQFGIDGIITPYPARSVRLRG